MDGDGNLLGEAFLDLKAPGESFCNACEFGQAEDELVRNIGYRDLEKGVILDEGTRRKRLTHFAGKGDKVVLAETGDVNISDKDHFVVIFLEYGIIDDVWEKG